MHEAKEQKKKKEDKKKTEKNITKRLKQSMWPSRTTCKQGSRKKNNKREKEVWSKVRRSMQSDVTHRL